MITIKKSLILDLDGTIRVSKSGNPFYENLEDIILNQNIEAKIQQFKNNDYFIAIVTNQAGVAHGFKTVKQVEAELNYTLKLFSNPNVFDIIKICYKDSNGIVPEFKIRSLCRKPFYGSLAIIENYALSDNIAIDWDNSLFVGDRKEDEECANSAKIPFMYIDNFLISE
jgi:HAD superfamily hydrolase (TIGR01662 family)